LEAQGGRGGAAERAAVCDPAALVLDSTQAGSQPSDGAQRKPPLVIGSALRLAGSVPGLRGFSDDLRPMPVEVLCRAIARILKDRAPKASVLTGRQLWQSASI
jgi:hypothetical protein